MKTSTQVREPSHGAANALIQPLSKGLGILDGPLAPSEISNLGWNLLREDLSLPTAVLYEDKLAHNLEWMQKFADAYGAKLAPHGKTTMAPKLFARQLNAGAWGITVATALHTRVAYEHRVRRVLMANQLVGRQNMALVSRLLRDPEFEFFCLVDSAEQTEMLGQYFQAQGQRLNVLVEVGVQDGRTGIRNRDQLKALLAALSSWKKQIALCGVEVFEGVLSDEASVRALLLNAVDLATELAREQRFDRDAFILSGAGSAWYDIVADVFCKSKFATEVEVILRPGCYLTHDVGIYKDAQQRIMGRNVIAQRMAPGLIPALGLWTYVQSLPEKGRAIIALGKRDAAFDAGLPVPTQLFRPGSAAPIPTPNSWKLTRMMDQHAFMETAEGGADLHIGDMIGFDISHPCLTFDKWQYLVVLDSNYQVVDILETFF
jgi:D-serine dehydratase